VSGIEHRLHQLRTILADEGLDGAIVRSTDPYLGEYVPPELALRPWLTGFTGSMGEALVGREQAWLFADGRYWLQAEAEVDPRAWQVVRVGSSGALSAALLDRLEALARGRSEPLRIGFEADRVTEGERREWSRRLEDSVTLVAMDPSPVHRLRHLEGSPALSRLDGPMRSVGPDVMGSSVLERVEALFEPVPKSVDWLWVQRLDDVAYLSGLRGRGLPQQSTFRGVALAARDGLWVGLDGDRTRAAGLTAPGLDVMTRSELFERLGRQGGTVGCDPAHTTVSAWQDLSERARVVSCRLPVAAQKARKRPEELAAMRSGFRRADRVMATLIDEVCQRVVDGEPVTEKDVADRVEALFVEAGAVSLSFRVIAAAGTHGAIIHYGTPDPERVLGRGELLLVDCGGLFEAGYATDLTRTFLLGAPDETGSPRQRFIYTSVLRAAIAGMRARLAPGATGAQLDGIVREALWAEGLDYPHGTGHGVGINVHESPPRISGSSTTVLEAGHVFSIEPGHYDAEFGGVRIENVCTCVEDPDAPGFLRVEPLTFAPLDERLIDLERLRTDEREWLARYRQHA
jgi:Xaa-Pro aminopeptidase